MSEFIFMFMGVFFFTCGYIIGKGRENTPNTALKKTPPEFENIYSKEYLDFLNYDGSEQE